MDAAICEKMTLLKISDDKWKEAKTFFQENQHAKSFDSKKNGRHFKLEDTLGVYAVVKDFFCDSEADFINLYIVEDNQNFIHLISEKVEAKIALESVMKNFGILTLLVDKGNECWYKLIFPLSFCAKKDSEKIKKDFTRIYKKLLNKSLIGELLFSAVYPQEKKQKLYRGLLSVMTPMTILTYMHELIKLHTNTENVLYVAQEFKKFFIIVTLIDRNKKTMPSLVSYLKDPEAFWDKGMPETQEIILYREIIQHLLTIINGYELCLMPDLLNRDHNKAKKGKLYLSNDGKYVVRDPKGIVQQDTLPKDSGIDMKNLEIKLSAPIFQKSVLEITSKRGHTFFNGDDDDLCILEGELSLVSLQASGYDSKRQSLIKMLKKVNQKNLVDLDQVVKIDFLAEMDRKKIDTIAEQFAFALKNAACYNFLKILPDDFYHLAWSRNLNNSNGEGKTIKKIIADYDSLSFRTTNDIVYACSYAHQLNVMIFYLKTCTKLLQIDDFNSAHAIYTGFNHISVSRLTYLKLLIPIREMLQEIEKTFSFKNSMENYRRAVKFAYEKGRIVVPFLALHLKELTFAEEGNPSLNTDVSLNVEKLELFGKMYSNLDNYLVQMYRAQPMQTCISLSRLQHVLLDEQKLYEASLHSFPKDTPDISKCKSIADLENKILIKRFLPAYLAILKGRDNCSTLKFYGMPKVYSKLLDFLDERICKKNLSKEEAETAMSLLTKIRLHVIQNHMITPELIKRFDKLNLICMEIVSVYNTSLDTVTYQTPFRRFNRG